MRPTAHDSQRHQSAVTLCVVCRYLIAMQPQDLQLLVAHAGWVLAADPEAGLEALLAVNPPLQPDLVMPIMQVGVRSTDSRVLCFADC
jgi:hypothetical protein